MNRPLSYRPLVGLLALLLLAGGAAVFAATAAAEVAHDCCEGHAVVEPCPMAPDAENGMAHDATPPGDGAMGGVMTCCSSDSGAPQPVAVVPTAPAKDAPAAVVARLPVPRLVPVPPLAQDAGPPDPPLRAHLVFSVLLI